MKHFTAHDPVTISDFSPDLEDDTDDLSRILGPMVAGARARGVADAFELMGIAAILIDGSGRVLHASGRAHRVLLPLVEIVENHLIGTEPGVNDQLQRLIEYAMGRNDTSSPAQALQLSDTAGRPQLNLKIMRFTDRQAPSVQLLRAVIVATEV